MDVTGSFLLFELSQKLFAIFVPSVQAVEPMRELISAPELPAFVEGLLSEEGTSEKSPLLPVLRLDSLLRLSRPARVPGLHTPLIVLRSADEEPTATFALLVERIHGIVRVEPNETDSPLSPALLPADPEDTLNGCVESILSLPEGRSAVVLSVPQLLFTEERERLAEFSRRGQERLAEVLVAKK